MSKANGGAERDRTADPLLAKQVLSQLSYSPNPREEQPQPIKVGAKPVHRHHIRKAQPAVRRFLESTLRQNKVVGPGRLELPTPRLSSVCSNQLSYGPISSDRACGSCLLRKRNVVGGARHTVRLKSSAAYFVAIVT